MSSGGGALDTSPPSTIATSLLFGTLTFTYASLAARTWLAGDSRPLALLKTTTTSSPLDLRSFPSIFILLHHSTVFGLILLLAYVCEYHPPYPHGDKSYDRDEFFFTVGIFFVAASFTLRRNDVGWKKKMEDETRAAIGGNKKEEDEPSTGAAAAAVSSSSVVAGNDDDDDDDDGGSDSSSRSGRETSTLITDTSSLPHATAPAVDIDVSDSQFSLSTKVARANPLEDVLNRAQTEEWKGWMQYVFLLYHYYHAEDVYNVVRIMITCYVWMTGFGNFSYFYATNDFGVARVLQMLWRLNFLVVFLCLSQGTSYILYYICPLHTFFFLMVYVALSVGRQLNYQKIGLRLKLMGVAVVIYLLWDVDVGLFRVMNGLWLSEEPTVGATKGTLWEWYFRSFLDHWSAFLGMIFAANYPITSLWYRKVEVLTYRRQWIVKGVVGVSLLMAFYIWLSGPFRQKKLVYNSTHPFFGFVPLLTYVYFRNLTPYLRSHSLDLFHQLGKTTLETYLMQHHIWLTSDAKSLLVLIPGWPKANMLLVTTIYFYVSRRLYKLTIFLRGMFLPNDKQFCYKSLTAIFSTILLFYFVALSLTVMNLTNLTAIGIISILCGICLYQFIMDTTWNKFKDSAPPMTTGPDSFLDSFMRAQHSKQSQFKQQDQQHLTKQQQQQQQHQPFYKDLPESFIARLSPPIIGAMVLFVIGLAWHACARDGAGKITPLPPTCESYANRGAWIRISPCNDMDMGRTRRDDGIASLACQSPMHAWGWNVTKSNEHCRFAHRPPTTLKKDLTGRRLMFLGDSMTRNMYHATLRAMGIKSGYHDATIAKHSDIDFELIQNGIQMEFKWAPLAVDQLTYFKELSTRPDNLPDVIITGGGAWDRLHVYATDEDQNSLKTTIKELVKEIRAMVERTVPVVWTIPTVIHTKALNHEEKRDHMKEEDMEEMRVLYKSLGVLASSTFVLDGPAFTKHRVEESYDGVHYPPAVYDGGAQILANAFDWILVHEPPRNPNWDGGVAELKNRPQPGEMANPTLGLMMLFFIFIGLLFFDGFMGFSYLGGLVQRGLIPADLYDEAFKELHRKINLPNIIIEGTTTVMDDASSSAAARRRRRIGGAGEESLKDVDDEIASLLTGSVANQSMLEMTASGNVGPALAVSVD